MSDLKDLKRIELPKGSRYRLSRSDGAGDSGHMLEAFDWDNPNGPHEADVLVVGKGVRCGSFYARSFTQQDWWLTTAIGEFTAVNESKTRIEFKTQNGKQYVLEVT